jgi:hypothetical protein
MYSWRSSVKPWSFCGAGVSALAAGAAAAGAAAIDDDGVEGDNEDKKCFWMRAPPTIAAWRAGATLRDRADDATRRRKACCIVWLYGGRERREEDG